MDDGLDGWAARIAVCQNRSQVPLAGAPLRLCGAAPALLATFWIPIEWSPGGFLSHYSGWLQRLASIYTATVEGAYMQGMAKRAAQQRSSIIATRPRATCDEECKRLAATSEMFFLFMSSLFSSC